LTRESVLIATSVVPGLWVSVGLVEPAIGERCSRSVSETVIGYAKKSSKPVDLGRASCAELSWSAALQLYAHDCLLSRTREARRGGRAS
jgi:hypothetical protein